MKKSTLYEIYDSALDVELITNKLRYIEKLNAHAGEIFLAFVKNGLVDEETIDNFIELSMDIESCEMHKEDTEELVNMICETLMIDSINSDDDFGQIIDNYSLLLENDMIDGFFYNSQDEAIYYKMLVVKEFNRILVSLENNDYEMAYIHDICSIMDAYKEVLDDLRNTKSNNNSEDYNNILIKRIKYFVDIVSDKDIIELDDKKYSAAMWTAAKIPNIEKLKVLKGIIKFNKGLSEEEFFDLVDIDSAEVNATTIGRLYAKSNIKVVKKDENTYVVRGNPDPEIERDIVKKIQKPNNNA